MPGKISCLAWKGDIKIDQEFMTKNSTENTAPSNLERTSPYMCAANSFHHLGRQVCYLLAVSISMLCNDHRSLETLFNENGIEEDDVLDNPS